MEHAFYDNEKAEKQPKTYQRKKEDHEFDLLIDIQKKLAQGKGKYYVRFAKNFNTKQVAKAVLYLKQHDIRSYDDLEKNVKTATEGHYFSRFSRGGISQLCSDHVNLVKSGDG